METVTSEDNLGNSSRSIEYSDSNIQDKMSAEDVFSQLTEDATWEDFVKKAQLSREEAEVLEGLLVQETFRDLKDKDIHQVKMYKERFVKEFTEMKNELEGHIAQLRELADKAKTVHRHCTIWSLVARSTSIVSGVLTIAGFGLAPVTAGVSLGVSVAGMGLGAASAVTEVTTNIVEYTKMSFIKADANKLASTKANLEETFNGFVHDIVSKYVPLGNNVAKSVEGMGKSIRGIQLIKANPRLAVRAMRFMNAGKISARKVKQVQKAFGGTALVMSKGARMACMATAGLFLLTDIYSVVKQSTHLQQGANSESADQLREQASELEKKLKDLQEFYVFLLEICDFLISQEHGVQKQEQN